jgi:TRAP-type mannitol/chloroaromatic compound transport system substrate-binding protein
MTRAGITAEFIDPGDLYVSLATGVLDGLAWGNARAYYELGFFEVAPYFQMPSMCPSAFSTFSMNKDLWDQLPPDLQSILVNATRVNGTHMRSTLKAADGELLLKAIDEWGVTVVTFSDEDVAQLSTWAMEFLDEISEMSPRCKEATDIVYHALDIFEAHR